VIALVNTTKIECEVERDQQVWKYQFVVAVRARTNECTGEGQIVLGFSP